MALVAPGCEENLDSDMLGSGETSLGRRCRRLNSCRVWDGVRLSPVLHLDIEKGTKCVRERCAIIFEALVDFRGGWRCNLSDTANVGVRAGAHDGGI